MIALLLLAFTFTLAPAQNGRVLTFRYPAGVTYIQVCAEVEGIIEQGPNETPWWVSSCWQPTRLVEDYPLRAGAVRARATLTIRTPEDTTEDLHTGWVTIRLRPEETE